MTPWIVGNVGLGCVLVRLDYEKANDCGLVHPYSVCALNLQTMKDVLTSKDSELHFKHYTST